jgi:hypothetical protein
MMNFDTSPGLSRSPRRLIADFAVAFILFNIVACAFMTRHVDAKSHASADNDYFLAETARADVQLVPVHGLIAHAAQVDRGHFTQLFSSNTDASGRSKPSPLGVLFLGFIFAALTALNLQLVRHLREAYAMPTRGNRRG